MIFAQYVLATIAVIATKINIIKIRLEGARVEVPCSDIISQAGGAT